MSKNSTKQATSKRVRSEATSKCTYANCNFTASTRRKVREHEKEHESEVRLQCPHPGCFFDCADAAVVDRHYKMKHAVNNPRAPPLAPVQNVEHPQPAAPAPGPVTVKPKSATPATKPVVPAVAAPKPVVPQSAAAAAQLVVAAIQHVAAECRPIAPIPKRATTARKRSNATPKSKSVAAGTKPVAVPAPKPVASTSAPKTVAAAPAQPIINKALAHVINPKPIARKSFATSAPSSLRNEITPDIYKVSTAGTESCPISIDDSDSEDEKPAKKQKLSPLATTPVPEFKVAPVPAPVPAPALAVTVPVTAQVTEWAPSATTIVQVNKAEKRAQDNEDEDEEDLDDLFCDADYEKYLKAQFMEENFAPWAPPPVFAGNRVPVNGTLTPFSSGWKNRLHE